MIEWLGGQRLFVLTIWLFRVSAGEISGDVTMRLFRKVKCFELGGDSIDVGIDLWLFVFRLAAAVYE